MIRFGSICSGIEAASAAWLPLGWHCEFMSEIEPFTRAVLRHHYPDTPLRGDFTTIRAGEYGAIDVLVGGTPCQSFSVAGLRGGLADERGNLALEYLRLAERLRPRWIVWENAPGVLSSLSHTAPDPCQPPDGMEEGAEWVGEDEYDADESHAFECFLAGLSQLGYGWAYRSFDAQFFGLAQRRERVFVVGYLGDWRRAAAVLFEPASLRWDTAPSRTRGQRVADSLTRGADSSGAGGYAGRRREDDVNLVANPLGAKSNGGWRGDLDNDKYVAHCLNAHGGSGRIDAESETFVTHSLRADGFDASGDGTGRGTPLVAAWGISSDAVDRTGEGDGSAGERAGLGITAEASPALRGRSNNSVATQSAVRRLTPRECERLMGFSDDYTAIQYRGKIAADGPRYRSLGNSMAVPIISWIGRRIAQQDRPG